MNCTKYFVFVYCYDSGSVESGPELSEGSSQVIKAASPEEAWKKLQKNLKMQRKLKKQNKKQLRRGKINLPHWYWMSAIMFGPGREKYTKNYFQVLDVESWGDEVSSAQWNYELVQFYKYN